MAAEWSEIVACGSKHRKNFRCVVEERKPIYSDDLGEFMKKSDKMGGRANDKSCLSS